MAIGKLGAKGGFGSLGALGKAGTSGPAPPLLSMDPSWTSANSTPLFDIDAAFVAGDDLQFEVQTAGGDWSGATVVHHTVTSGEISGSQITLGIGPLANGNFEARCKFKHSSGSYSAYSSGAGPSGGLPFTITASSSGLAMDMSNFTNIFVLLN